MTVVSEVSWRYYHVRLGFGLVVEGDGHLSSNFPTRPEGRPERFLDRPDPGCVRGSLRFADQKLSRDQLNTVARLKGSQVHKPFILKTAPPLGACGRRSHQ